MSVTAQTTGTLLVAAFAVFLVGAGFWLIKEFEQPLDARLRAVHQHRRRWRWIHAWMVAGTLVSVLAVASLVQLLQRDGGGRVATTALVLFTTGCLGSLVSLAFGLSATPRAAEQTVQLGAVPPAYRSRHGWATALYVGHMLLSYATFALLGSAILRGSLLPTWLGWTGVGTGVAGLVGFPLLRGGPFAPPILAHAFGLLVGLVLLLG